LIVDGHIHAGFWSEERFLGRGVAYEEIDRVLEECGIGGAVLTSTDVRANDQVLEFIHGKSRSKYWLFPWINPAVEGEVEYLESRIDDVNGIKLHPSCDRIRITDPETQPILEFAGQKGLPVMVHCGRWQEMSSYRLAIEAAASHPAVNLVLSHMGGDTPELEMATIEAIETGRLENVYLGIEGVREYWAVQQAVDRLGADRVIFGSDFPLGHPLMYMGLVDALRITGSQKDKILGDNILRLVNEG
jgi:hypothetical protein